MYKAIVYDTTTGKKKNKNVHFKTVPIETPALGENVSFFFTDQALTIREMRSIVRGSSPSVSWTLRHDTDRTKTGSGLEVVTGGTTTTSQTSGDNITSFNNEDIPANSYLWFETSAVSGTIDEISVTLMEELSTDLREPELPPAEDIPVDGGEVWWNTSFFQKGFELNDWWFLSFYSSPNK